MTFTSDGTPTGEPTDPRSGETQPPTTDLPAAEPPTWPSTDWASASDWASEPAPTPVASPAAADWSAPPSAADWSAPPPVKPSEPQARAAPALPPTPAATPTSAAAAGPSSPSDHG